MGRWQVFGLAASLFFLFRRIKKRQEKSLKTDVFRQIMVEQLELNPNQIFDGFQRNGFCAVFEVVGENQLVVIDVDGIDEGVDDLPLVLDVIHIAELEAIDPADD